MGLGTLVVRWSAQVIDMPTPEDVVGYYSPLLSLLVAASAGGWAHLGLFEV